MSIRGWTSSNVHNAILHFAEILDEFWEQFIDVMDANAVAFDLLHYNIIDKGDEARLSITYNPRQRNQFLHSCLKQKCTMEALKVVCDVIINMEGNPKMRALGNNMKRRLETGACVCACVCACMHACVCVCVRACVHVYVLLLCYTFCMTHVYVHTQTNPLQTHSQNHHSPAHKLDLPLSTTGGLSQRQRH